jgi:hypothetical protein
VVFVVGCSRLLWLAASVLPELFPCRSTGAGVSFNFGRILTGFGVLATGVRRLHGLRPRGNIAISFMLSAWSSSSSPDTTKDKLKDERGFRVQSSD